MKNYGIIILSITSLLMTIEIMASPKFQPWPPRLIDSTLSYPITVQPYPLRSRDWYATGGARFNANKSQLELPPHSSLHLYLSPNVQAIIKTEAPNQNLEIAKRHGSIWLEKSEARAKPDSLVLPKQVQDYGIWLRLRHNGKSEQSIHLNLATIMKQESRPKWEHWYRAVTVKSASKMPLIDRHQRRFPVYSNVGNDPMYIDLTGRGWLRLNLRAKYVGHEMDHQQACGLKYQFAEQPPHYLSRKSPISFFSRTHDQSILFGQAATSYLELSGKQGRLYFWLTDSCVMNLDWLEESPIFNLPQSPDLTLLEAISELAEVQKRDLAYAIKIYETLNNDYRQSLGSEIVGTGLHYLRQEWLYFRDLKAASLKNDESISGSPCFILPVGEMEDFKMEKLIGRLRKHYQALPHCYALKPQPDREQLEYNLADLDAPTVIRVLLKSDEKQVASSLTLRAIGPKQVTNYRIEIAKTDRVIPPDAFHQVEVILPAVTSRIELIRDDNDQNWPSIAIQLLTARNPELDWANLQEMRQTWSNEQFLDMISILSAQKPKQDVDAAIANSISYLRDRLSWYRQLNWHETWKYSAKSPIFQEHSVTGSSWYQELKEQNRIASLERLCQLKLVHGDKYELKEEALTCMASSLRFRSALWRFVGLKLDEFVKIGNMTSLIEIAETLEQLDHLPIAAAMFLIVENLAGEKRDLEKTAKLGWERLIEQLAHGSKRDSARWSVRQYESMFLQKSSVSGHQLEYFRVTPEQPLTLDLHGNHRLKMKIVAHRELEQSQTVRSLDWLRFHHMGQHQSIPLVSQAINSELGKSGRIRYASSQDYWLHNLKPGQLIIETDDYSTLIRIETIREVDTEQDWLVSFSQDPLKLSYYRQLDQVHRLQLANELSHRFRVQAELMAKLYSNPNQNWEEVSILDILESLSHWEYHRPPQSQGGWYREQLDSWSPEHPVLAAYQHALPRPRSNYLAVIHGDLEFESAFEVHHPSRARLDFEVFRLFDDGLGDHHIELRWGNDKWVRHRLSEESLIIEKDLEPGPQLIQVRFTDYRPGRLAYLYLALDTQQSSQLLAPRRQRTWAVSSQDHPLELRFEEPQLLRIHRLRDGYQQIQYRYLEAGDTWSSHDQADSTQSFFRIYRLTARNSIPSFDLPELREPTLSTPRSSLTAVSTPQPQQMRPVMKSTASAIRSQSLGLSVESGCYKPSEIEDSRVVCTEQWTESLHWRISNQRAENYQQISVNAYPHTSPLIHGNYQWTGTTKYGTGLGLNLAIDSFYARLQDEQPHFWAASIRPSIFYVQRRINWQLRSQLRLALREFNRPSDQQLPSNAWNNWMENHARILLIAQNFTYYHRADQSLNFRAFLTSNATGSQQLLDHLGIGSLWQKLWSPLFSTSVGIRATHYFTDAHRAKSSWAIAPRLRANYLYRADNDRPWHIYIQVGNDLEREQSNIAVGVETTLRRGQGSLSPQELDAMSLPFSHVAQSERYRLYSDRKEVL